MKTIEMGSYRLPVSSKPAGDIRIKMNWEWIVLYEGEETALLLSRDIVDWDFFHGENRFLLGEAAKPTTWEKSNIRETLQEFYSGDSTEFDAEERKRILPNENGDYLFLLTKEEVEKYLPEKESRGAEILFDETDMRCITRMRHPWWLNTVGAEDNRMMVVDEFGDIIEEGVENDADEVGIRPAMWIDTEGDGWE